MNIEIYITFFDVLFRWRNERDSIWKDYNPLRAEMEMALPDAKSAKRCIRAACCVNTTKRIGYGMIAKAGIKDFFGGFL